jgi:acetyl-CoA carboxylase biotin carboxylase subunit
MQRRHQKILEEAPAPGIPRKLIEKHRRALRAACKKIGYRGAGTFEFLYENGEFYFIEMNTRVQVEHPVTELITGIDIVKTQIMVAAGEKLPVHAARHRHAGATRSSAGSTPSTRTTSRRRRAASPCGTPPGGPGVRVDSHVYNNYFVPPNYDSMIGKIIVTATRASRPWPACAPRLNETVIEGINTNIPLHRELMVDAKFMQAAPTSTTSKSGSRSTSAERRQRHVRTCA